MLLSELSKKEVVNISDCKCLGTIVDLQFDECKGRILKLTARDSGRIMKFWGCHQEYVFEWEQIVRIGPDVVLVDVCTEKVQQISK